MAGGRHVAWVLVAGLVAGCSHTAQQPSQSPQPLPEPVAPFVNPGATVADYLACLRDQDVMMVSAHRGGPDAGLPENALETFAATLARAPMLIETDVRMTSDGVFVLLHDEDLERTTTGAGLIADTPYDGLDAVRLRDNDGAATPYAIPTLEEALAWARGRAFLQLDVKAGAPVSEVAQAVVDAEAQAYAAVIVYNEEDALAAAAVDPALTISAEIMDLERLDAMEEAGLAASRLMAWTGIETERPELWRALNERGVSAAWGSLWYLDAEIAESGDVSEFARLAEDGLDVLSSDYHRDAYDSAETRQDTQAAVRACNDGA